MPFKSEKQRRYLWANEPEIARDWTDTYGSKIKKAEGGITRIPFQGGGADAGTRSFAESSYAGDTQGFQSAASHGFQGEQGISTQEKMQKDIQSGSEVVRRGKLADERRASAKAKAEQKAKDKKKTSIPSILGLGIQAFDKFKGWNNAMQRNQFKNWYEKKNPHPMGFVWDDWTDEEWEEKSIDEIPGYREYLTGPTTQQTGDGGATAWWRLQGYPSYEAWQAAQGQGGTTVAEEVVEEVSPFQQSLNTGVASSLSPYYVGDNPTAANIAWGQQFGVDPRTMYMAEGGPIRQRYFLGKIVKKIGRAAKKVIKSPFGKAALLGFAGFGIPGGSGLTGGFFNSAMGKKLGMKMLMEKGAKDFTMASLDPFKAGIFGLTLAPFLMGDQDKEEEVAFDYAGAKEDYLNEMMRIRRAAQAGTLDPVQFPYQGIGPSYKDGGRIGYAGGGSEDPMLVDEYKKYVFEMEEMGLQPMSFEEFRRQALAGMASGGRAGYYAGGQSIPSENSLEDARKTAMQDRLGGITEVMKQADLYRQGDVGQMYMAEGGSTQEAGIMDLGGVEKDYRETGGFVPIGKEEKADDVPARLSVNEFVMTADAVRGMGDGDIDKGAERMEDLMETLEVKGKRNQGASDMFEVSERLSAVV